MLIDVHCHVNLYLNIEDILCEAENAGVKKIIGVGMSATSLKRVLEIANRYDSIFCMLGIHPEEVKMNKDIENQLDDIANIIRKNHNKICGIGEIGLDHHFVKENELYPLQKKVFEKMLTIAQELQMPVNLHTKGAEKIVFDTLSSYDIPNVNIHWYSGPENFLKLGIERGYYFSITPAINYSTAVKNVASKVETEYILLESDGPVKYSGELGTPAMIKKVLDIISKVKNITSDNLERQICENTKRIFPLIFR